MQIQTTLEKLEEYLMGHTCQFQQKKQKVYCLLKGNGSENKYHIYKLMAEI